MRLKNSPILIIIIFALFSSVSFGQSQSKIRQYCPQSRDFSVIESAEELENKICEIQKIYSSDKRITEISGQVLKTLNALITQGTSEDWESDGALNESLNNLSSSINEHVKKGSTPPKTALGIELKKFREKWGSSESRWKNSRGYLNDLTKIVKMTKTGQRVLDCYKKATSPLISGDYIKILEKPKDGSTYGFMHFALVEDQNHYGKFIKTITFNPGFSPISALVSFTHELKHGCNSAQHARNEEILKSPPSVPELPDMSSSFPSDFAKKPFTASAEAMGLKTYRNVIFEHPIDEMRAYKVSVELFSELAKNSPEAACDEYYVGFLFGKQPISSSEYHIKLDEMLQDGTYPLYLVSYYAAAGNLNPNYVLKLDEDGLPTNELSAELVEAMKKEGIYVKK